MQTVIEKMAAALEGLLEHAVDCTKVTCGRCTLLEAKAIKALARHRKEPECKCDGPECPGYDMGVEAQRERVG